MRGPRGVYKYGDRLRSRISKLNAFVEIASSDFRAPYVKMEGRSGKVGSDSSARIHSFCANSNALSNVKPTRLFRRSSQRSRDRRLLNGDRCCDRFTIDVPERRATNFTTF